MEASVLFFLTSGIFLGWALGANDAANVFGTAVGTRMIRFTTAAVICSVFVVLGAVFSGAGAAHTLGKLGAINALAGSFMAAFSAALAVYLMTKASVPVSTTQAIVGAIIGWNLFSDTLTDSASLFKILSTWVICPLLAAAFAIGLFKLINWIIHRYPIHLLRTDAYTRVGLIFAGAFGSYSLGANNIGNVMGVFVPSSPFTDFNVAGLFTITSVQQLFLIGALAIGIGVITYSKRVMMTVGNGLVALSPVGAWVVVVSHSIVLFLFASQGLEQFLASHGLPTIPLVPVSSSQAVVGAVIGIALVKGGRGIRWRVLGGIGMGWIATPIVAGFVCFLGLFFLQNVFNQQVYTPIPYRITDQVALKLQKDGIPAPAFRLIVGEPFNSAVDFKQALDQIPALDDDQYPRIYEIAEVHETLINAALFAKLNSGPLSSLRIKAVKKLAGQSFDYKWQLADALAEIEPDWQLLSESKITKAQNKKLKSNLSYLYRLFNALR
jgi:inorganic phosphate transporter, PiT family